MTIERADRRPGLFPVTIEVAPASGGATADPAAGVAVGVDAGAGIGRGVDADGAPGAAADDAVRLARAGLLRVCEPPAPAVAAFVDQVGAVAAWRAITARTAPRDVRAATAARIGERSGAELDELAAADLAAAAAVDARLLVPEDPGWPALAVVGFTGAAAQGVTGATAPLGLYVRGHLPATLPLAAVTVVGSRSCSEYGRRVALDLAAGVAAAGVTVVSGAAFGIDAAAHRGAMVAGRVAPEPDCRTVAVLACGIDQAYPAAHAPMLEQIAVTGALVSEYPPGTTPARHRFLVRNRLIAALGSATVVVEAGRRSGTLSTATAARHLGRAVLVVPGPVTSALSVGCHLLLREPWAHLVTDADDVLAVIGPLGRPGLREVGGTRDRSLPGRDRRHPTDGLDAETARVHEALPTRGTRTVAELSVEAALPGRVVVTALAVLESFGLARRDGAMWRRGPG
jgi:DNA processing protein